MHKSFYPIFFLIFVATIWYSNNEPSMESVAPSSAITSKEFKLDNSTNAFLSKFETEFEAGMSQRGIPGGAIVIVRDSMIIFQKGFGVKAKGTADSVDINTVFRLGSISKGFASILAGTFYEEEEISWDEPILSYLPDFALNDSSQTQRVQVNHILSHTTGLPRHTYTNLVEDGLSLNRIIPRLKNVELISEEGVQLAYQNAAYAVIEKVIEAKSDTSFGGELKLRLFDPLSMDNASSTYEEILANNNKAMPHLHTSRRSGLQPVPITKKYYNAISAGGINGSISDMGKWLLMLIGNNPEVISKETLNRIYEPIATINNRRYSRNWYGVNKSYYGMGWRILDNNGQKIVYHGGYVNGYRSEIAFDKENKIGICILFNSPSSYALQVIPKFFNEFSTYSTTTTSPTSNTE